MKKMTIAALTGTMLLSAATVAQAETFVGLTYGSMKTGFDTSQAVENAGGKFQKTIQNDSVYGIRVGDINEQRRMYISYENASDTYHSDWKARVENLTASYDMLFPAYNKSTSFFAGGTAGINKLTTESKNMSRDNDYGYAIGLQAGVLHQFTQNISAEAGYKYLWHNAKVDVKQNGTRLGSTKLEDSSALYIAVDYRF